MSKKKLNIPLSEFINLKEKKPEDMTGCVVLYKNGGLDVATWHSHAYNPDDEPGYFKQGCFYMGKENIIGSNRKLYQHRRADWFKSVD